MVLLLAVLALFYYAPQPVATPSGFPASTTYETEGIIRSVDDEQVTLELSDGSSTTIPIKDLNLNEDIKDRVGWELHVSGEMKVE